MKLTIALLILVFITGCSEDGSVSHTALKADFTNANSVALGFGTSQLTSDISNQDNLTSNLTVSPKASFVANTTNIDNSIESEEFGELGTIQYHSSSGSLIKLLNDGTTENVLNGDWAIYHVEKIYETNSENKTYVIVSGDFPEILADKEGSEEQGVTCYLLAFDSTDPESLGTCLSEEKIGTYDHSGIHRSFDAFGDSPGFAVIGTNVIFAVNESTSNSGSGFSLYQWSSETKKTTTLMSKPNIGAVSDIFVNTDNGNFCFFSPSGSASELKRRAGLERYSYCYDNSLEQFIEFSNLLSSEQKSRFDITEQQLIDINNAGYDENELANNDIVIFGALSENMFTLGKYIILSSLYYLNLKDLTVTTIPQTWIENKPVFKYDEANKILTTDPLLDTNAEQVKLSLFVPNETLALEQNQSIDNLCRADTKASAIGLYDKDWIFDVNTSGGLDIISINKDDYIKSKLENNGEFDLSSEGQLGFGLMYFDGYQDCWGVKEYSKPFGLFYVDILSSGTDVISENYLKSELIEGAGLIYNQLEGIYRIDVVGEQKLSVVVSYNGAPLHLLVDHGEGTVLVQDTEKESYARLAPLEE